MENIIPLNFISKLQPDAGVNQLKFQAFWLVVVTPAFTQDPDSVVFTRSYVCVDVKVEWKENGSNLMISIIRDEMNRP